MVLGNGLEVNEGCEAVDLARLDQRYDAALVMTVHDTAAPLADQAVGHDNFLDARQCGRQIADGAFRNRLGCRLVAAVCYFTHIDYEEIDEIAREVARRETDDLFAANP